jgi:hypothetical protein
MRLIYVAEALAGQDIVSTREHSEMAHGTDKQKKNMFREMLAVCRRRCLQLHSWMRTSESAAGKCG